MNVGFLHQITVLAQADGQSESMFAEMSRRFAEGKTGMYPIALCAILALAIIVERIIVLFFTASSSSSSPGAARVAIPPKLVARPYFDISSAGVVGSF